MKCNYCGFDLQESFFLRKDRQTYYSPLWCSVCRTTFPEEYTKAKYRTRSSSENPPKSGAQLTKEHREKQKRKNEENRKFWLGQKEKKEQ